MFWQTKHAITRERSERTLKKWAKSPRIRQSGNQLFLSSDRKYTRREPLIERLSLHIRACARVLYYCPSACHKSNSRRNLGDLSSNIINHHQIVLNAQRVEQVKHSLGHHRRTAQVMRCPLERRVAWGRCRPSLEQWSQECTSHNECISLSIRTVLTREEVREVKRNNDGLMTDWD